MRALAACIVLVFLAACSGGGGSVTPASTSGTGTAGHNASAVIRHIVIIVQENRTVDNLFNGFPGADTATSGKNSVGETIPLQPISIAAPYDMPHSHTAFVKQYHGGAMDGFNYSRNPTPCGAACPPPALRAYGFVPQAETVPYWDMARRYTFADRMFQSNTGPSFPAHQYLISGTALASTSSPLLAASNARHVGCDAAPGATVLMIDPATGDTSHRLPPCFEHPTLFDLLDAHGLTWRYYQAALGGGVWNAPDAIAHIRYGPDYANVVAPETNVLTDIHQHALAAVSWVTPSRKASDHGFVTDGSGPDWVGSIVNALGESSYWNDTAIFVVWDDWGGWYDHVPPQQFNAAELSFRVPMIVVSPYARRGYVSHVQHEFGSIVRFTEETFGLGSLGYTDARADNLADCFDFGVTPLAFRHVQTRRSAADFLRAPRDDRSIDED